MAIRIIQQNSEEAFLKALLDYSKNAGNRGILLCRFSLTDKHRTADEFLPAVSGILGNFDCDIFFCMNGDVVVAWQGSLSATLPEIKISIKRSFLSVFEQFSEQAFFQFFESDLNSEQLHQQFMIRLKEGLPSAHVKPPPAAPIIEKAPEATFTAEQQLALQFVLKERASKTRLEPHDTSILIVEDQEFSRKLLLGMIQQYTCYAAKDGAEAIRMYAAHAPDIVFLDVELPDINGHEIARLLRKTDPKSHVVMVTGNSYAKDVEAAKKNKIQGFIVKPYSKQKIFAAIDHHLKLTKATQRK